MQYVYRLAEPGLWTAGYYDINGAWCPEGDFSDREEAARRVNYLNGGDQRPGEGIKANDPATRLIDVREVLELIPWSPTTLWRKIRDGKFPRPVNTSGPRRLWRARDVKVWIEGL